MSSLVFLSRQTEFEVNAHRCFSLSALHLRCEMLEVSVQKAYTYLKYHSCTAMFLFHFIIRTTSTPKTVLDIWHYLETGQPTSDMTSAKVQMLDTIVTVQTSLLATHIT
jgi:hypothetical protein